MEKGQYFLNKKSILFSPEIMKDKSEDLSNPTLLFTLPSDKFIAILKEVKEHKFLGNREKFLKEVFNMPLEELVAISRDIYYKLLLFQKALSSILNNWRITKIIKIDEYEHLGPVEYTAFEVEYGVKEEAIKEGAILLTSPDNKKLVVEFIENGLEIEKKIPMVRLTCEKDRKVWLEGLIKEIDDWMLNNSYYKGKKIKWDGTFLDIKKGKYSWDDIILDEIVKNEIKRNITDYFELKEIYKKNNLPSKRGILCYGIPGTGKTLLGKVLASQVDSTFIWVTASDVPDAGSVSDLFKMARELSPTIIFFEDLDLYASIRGYDISNDNILGEILVQIDGFIENSDIFIIATTNDIAAIEPALKDRPSRFDYIVEFKPLNEKLRANMLSHLMKGYKTKEDPHIIAKEVAKLTGKMTGAVLNEFFISAVKMAIEKRNIDEEKRVILSCDIFVETVEKIGINNKRLIGFGK